MFRVIVFFSLITSAFASEKLEVLVNAAASFSATIQQQLEMLQSNPSPTELAEKTIDYAVAKTAYFKALRAEVPGDQYSGLAQPLASVRWLVATVSVRVRSRRRSRT